MIFPHSATELNEQEVNDWACSFQHAAVDAIMNGINTALTNNPVRCVVAGGGVLANSLLRTKLNTISEQFQIPVHLPEATYCVDNAAMIAGLGYHLFMSGHRDPLSITASARGIAS